MMNEISLCSSFKSTFNKNLYIKYQTFLLNLPELLQNIRNWPLVCNIFNEAVLYMIKESKNGVFFLKIEIINLFIDEILLILCEKTDWICENFVKNERDIFTNFITFLKNLKNCGYFNRILLIVLMILLGFFMENQTNQHFFSDRFLKIIKILKPIASISYLFDILLQKVVI